MKLAFFLYLTDILHSINEVFIFLIVIYFAVLAGFIFISATTQDNCDKEIHNSAIAATKKIIYKWWAIALIALISLAIPTQRTMYLMLGSIYLSKSNLPSKVSQALELKLDDIIKEMKQDNDKKESK
jgi:heme/copper-type cytochrome/quinol oxidase subunit 2